MLNLIAGSFHSVIDGAPHLQTTSGRRGAGRLADGRARGRGLQKQMGTAPFLLLLCDNVLCNKDRALFPASGNYRAAQQ